MQIISSCVEKSNYMVSPMRPTHSAAIYYNFYHHSYLRIVKGLLFNSQHKKKSWDET